jgi:hypothetical protein
MEVSNEASGPYGIVFLKLFCPTTQNKENVLDHNLKK